MKLLADEGVDSPIVAGLRRDGYDVVYVAEMAPGIRDEEVLALAHDEHRLLVTGDRDYGELVFRQGKASSGVVLVGAAKCRVRGVSPGRLLPGFAIRPDARARAASAL